MNTDDERKFISWWLGSLPLCFTCRSGTGSCSASRSIAGKVCSVCTAWILRFGCAWSRLCSCGYQASITRCSEYLILIAKDASCTSDMPTCPNSTVIRSGAPRIWQTWSCTWRTTCRTASSISWSQRKAVWSHTRGFQSISLHWAFCRPIRPQWRNCYPIIHSRISCVLFCSCSWIGWKGGFWRVCCITFAKPWAVCF